MRRLGNPTQSIEIAKHTRALYPRDVDLMTELGASYVATNQSQNAIKILDSALRFQPQNARLWSLKGAALDQLEMFDKARQHYTKALGLAPSDPSIMANVGLSYALEGDPKTAEIWLRRAANSPGASPSVRQNLALVLGLQGKLDEAEKWAKQDLDQNAAQNNLDYIRSLRGSTPSATASPRTPTAAIQQPRTYGQNRPAPRSLQQYEGTQPQPAFGARLTIAGDPSSSKGPKTASEAARAAARQQNKLPRTQPAPMAARQAANPQTVLSQIAQGNQSKLRLAQQQRAQLINRAQAGQVPAPQAGYYPQQPMPYGQMPPQARTPYGQAAYGQPYPPQQTYPVSRAPARTRRR